MEPPDRTPLQAKDRAQTNNNSCSQAQLIILICFRDHYTTFIILIQQQNVNGR